MPAQVTQPAPDFTADAVVNGEIKKGFKLSELRGKYVVLFFYPLDFTFVCPTELGDMADLYPEFQKLGVEVYSVSTDTHHVHAAWQKASDTIAKITYYMVGDPSGTITNNFTTTGPESSGVLVFSNANSSATIRYDGLEPIDMTGSTVTDLVFNLPGVADSTITRP